MCPEKIGSEATLPDKTSKVHEILTDDPEASDEYLSASFT